LHPSLPTRCTRRDGIVCFGSRVLALRNSCFVAAKKKYMPFSTPGMRKSYKLHSKPAMSSKSHNPRLIIKLTIRCVIIFVHTFLYSRNEVYNFLCTRKRVGLFLYAWNIFFLRERLGGVEHWLILKLALAFAALSRV
jgi:hypothetical protein